MIYVDRAQLPFKGMSMCHMIADSLDELHAMASQIGMERAWFQERASFPHYDLNEEKRARALALGAEDCDRVTFVTHLRRLRALPDYVAWQRSSGR